MHNATALQAETTMNWYYLENGQQRGPVNETDFSGLVQQGTIRQDTLLWCEGMTGWKAYGELLAPAAAPAAAAPAATLATATANGSLRVKKEEAVAAADVAACTYCGAVVPVSQLKAAGTASLCGRCQAVYGRQAQTGFGPASGSLEYSNPWLRIAAYLLDSVFCSIGAGVLIGASVALGALTIKSPQGALLLFIGTYVCVLIWTLYYFVGGIASHAATYGMRILKLKVITNNGGAVGGWRAFGRFLMFGLIVQFTLGLGNLTAFFDSQRRALHDMICGTIVVKS